MSNIVKSVPTLSSKLVAEMVGEDHRDLLKKVRKYEEYLGEGNFSLTDYFIKTTYRTEQNKVQPCYRITRKGCDLIAHKLTGKRGVLFTAQYIECFERLKAKAEGLPKKPTSLEELITSPELVKRLAEELIEARNEIARLKGSTYQQVEEVKAIEYKSHEDLYTVTDIAALYGMAAKSFNELLWRMHIIRHTSTGWVLYAPYADKGYAERYWKNLKWTESGKAFLIKKLKKKGYMLIGS